MTLLMMCRPEFAMSQSAAAWGVLRCAAVEFAGKAWQGLDCSRMSHPAVHMKVKLLRPCHPC